jgi:hypothetical protein
MTNKPITRQWRTFDNNGNYQRCVSDTVVKESPLTPNVPTTLVVKSMSCHYIKPQMYQRHLPGLQRCIRSTTTKPNMVVFHCDRGAWADRDGFVDSRHYGLLEELMK